MFEDLAVIIIKKAQVSSSLEFTKEVSNSHKTKGTEALASDPIRCKNGAWIQMTVSENSCSTTSPHTTAKQSVQPSGWKDIDLLTYVFTFTNDLLHDNPWDRSSLFCEIILVAINQASFPVLLWTITDTSFVPEEDHELPHQGFQTGASILLGREAEAPLEIQSIWLACLGPAPEPELKGKTLKREYVDFKSCQCPRYQVRSRWSGNQCRILWQAVGS